MFVDANDVIFYDNPENIKKKFLEFNKNIVISAEKNCSTDKDIIEFSRNNFSKSKSIKHKSSRKDSKEMYVFAQK